MKHDVAQSPIPAPPKPGFVASRTTRAGAYAGLRRRVKRAALNVIDRGWFGFVPLETHVAMCGFPRSGTTLLLLMMEAAYPGAATFRRERPALAAANNDWPGRHRLMITKRPDDVFWLDEVREAYQGRRTKPLFVLSVRDPRSVLTSVHAQKKGYCVPTSKWRSVHEHMVYNTQFDDVTVVEYRDLVERPAGVQRQLTDFIGQAAAVSFDRFHEAVPEGFDMTALNGLRPLDPSTLDKWRAEKHRARIKDVLLELPELPDRLVEMGYEQDDAWVRDYL